MRWYKCDFLLVFLPFLHLYCYVHNSLDSKLLVVEVSDGA